MVQLLGATHHALRALVFLREPFPTSMRQNLPCEFFFLALCELSLKCLLRARLRLRCGIKLVQRVCSTSFAMVSAYFKSAILLVRTYAFLGRDKKLLAILCCMFLGVVSYQVYVASSKLLRKSLRR
jgi:hypothetical protein